MPFRNNFPSPALSVSLQLLLSLQSVYIFYFAGATRWCSWLHIAQRPEPAEGSYRCSVRTKTDFGGRASTLFCNEGESCCGMGDVLFSQDSATKSDTGRKSWIMAADRSPQSCACMQKYTRIETLYTWLQCEFCTLALFWQLPRLPILSVWSVEDSRRFTAQYPPGSKDSMLFSRSMIKMQKSKAEGGEMHLLLHLGKGRNRIRSCLGGPRQDPLDLTGSQTAVVLASCQPKDLFSSEEKPCI